MRLHSTQMSSVSHRHLSRGHTPLHICHQAIVVAVRMPAMVLKPLPCFVCQDQHLAPQLSTMTAALDLILAAVCYNAGCRCIDAPEASINDAGHLWSTVLSGGRVLSPFVLALHRLLAFAA